MSVPALASVSGLWARVAACHVRWSLVTGIPVLKQACNIIARRVCACKLCHDGQTYMHTSKGANRASFVQPRLPIYLKHYTPPAWPSFSRPNESASLPAASQELSYTLATGQVQTSWREMGVRARRAQST